MKNPKTKDLGQLIDKVAPSDELRHLREKVVSLEKSLERRQKDSGQISELMAAVLEAVPTAAPSKLVYKASESVEVDSPVSHVHHLTDWHIGEKTNPEAIEEFGHTDWATARARIDNLGNNLLRNVFSFNGDQLLGSENVSVDVLLSGVKVGHSSISVQANSPQVILYDNDPLRGEILERALPATFNFSSSQLTLQAEPYFFSNSSVSAGKIQYTWTVNGQETTGPSSAQGILSLRQTGAGTGSATVGVTAQNTDNSAYFQSASQALQLTFGQSTGNALSSFLGL